MIRRVLGVILMLVGGIATLIYVVARFDPVGSQLANDADPFGVRPSRSSGVMGVGLSLAVVAVGGWLCRRVKRHHLPGARSAK